MVTTTRPHLPGGPPFPPLRTQVLFIKIKEGAGILRHFVLTPPDPDAAARAINEARA